MAGLIKRGNIFYVQWYVGQKERRRSLRTDNLQIAKERLRQFESARIRGDDLPLPTHTKLPDILEKYAGHVRTTKTAKSAQTDVYYLRQMFGPICPALQINSRKASLRAMKRPPKPGLDRRFRMSTIDVSHLEEITTTDVANFIGNHVRSRGLAPKTANRYREVVHTFFSWAMQEQGVRMPEQGQTIRRELTLKKADRIDGIVVDEAGKPVADVRVVLMPSPTNAALSDKRGRFTMTWVKWYDEQNRPDDKAYELIALDLKGGRAGVLKMREETEGLRLRLKPAVTITGTVVDSEGKPEKQAIASPMLRGDGSVESEWWHDVTWSWRCSSAPGRGDLLVPKQSYRTNEFDESRCVVYHWRMDYNHSRPRGDLGYMSLTAFAMMCHQQSGGAFCFTQDREIRREILLK